MVRREFSADSADETSNIAQLKNDATQKDDFGAAPRPATSGFVYVIQAGSDGPIKIGYARDPHLRLGKLQVSHYLELRLIATTPGTFHEEWKLHAALEGWRIRGEWFWVSEEVLRTLCERFERSEKYFLDCGLIVHSARHRKYRRRATLRERARTVLMNSRPVRSMDDAR